MNPQQHPGHLLTDKGGEADRAFEIESRYVELDP
jgi:hypothetical protein